MHEPYVRVYMCVCVQFCVRVHVCVCVCVCSKQLYTQAVASAGGQAANWQAYCSVALPTACAPLYGGLVNASSTGFNMTYGQLLQWSDQAQMLMKQVWHTRTHTHTHTQASTERERERETMCFAVYRNSIQITRHDLCVRVCVCVCVCHTTAAPTSSPRVLCPG